VEKAVGTGGEGAEERSGAGLVCAEPEGEAAWRGAEHMSLGRVEMLGQGMVAGFRAGFIAGLWIGGCPRRCWFSCPCEASDWRWGLS